VKLFPSSHAGTDARGLLSSPVHNGNAFKSHINRFVPTTKAYGRDPKTKGTCPL